MSNPALSLSPEMIIGLLDALSSQKEENIFVKDFLDLLNAHPVVRASRDRSLAPSPLSLVSPAPVPALPATIEVSSAVDSSEKTSSVSTSATNVVQSAVLEDINQSNTDIEDGGGRGGEEGKGTGTCCRNGVKKVNLKPKKGAVKRGAGGGGDLGRKAKRLKDVILESEEEEEKEDGDNEQKEGKGRRGRKRWEAPAWLQDGTPPPTDSRTTDLINHLARLDLNQDLQTLIMLCRRLIQPDLSISDVDIPPTSLAAAIADCVKRESNVVCESFYEMISLIRLAFYIEK
jgi:hypothetical protein